MFDEDLVEKEKLCNRLSGDAFYYIKSSDIGGQIKATETEKQHISSIQTFISTTPLGISCNCCCLRAVECKFRTVILHICMVLSH